MWNILFTVVSSVQFGIDLRLLHVSIAFFIERFIKRIIDYSSNTRCQFACLIIGVKATLNHRPCLNLLSQALFFADTSKVMLRQTVVTEKQVHKICNADTTVCVSFVTHQP